jgi:RND superfamily putative drug exporter
MIALWLVALVGAIVLNVTLDGKTSDKFEIPGTESQEAFDLLDQKFPAQSGSTAQIVFAAPAGVDLADAETKEAISTALEEIRGQEGVASVTDPFETGTVSPDGRVAYAQVRYPVTAQEVEHDQFEEMSEAAATVEDAGVQVELGGEVVTANEQAHAATSELIGLGVAVIVLLISFGSLLAMGLPIITALIGVGIGIMGIGILAAFTDLSSTAPTLATMIGLAVGIDYALFIVTRHRQNLHLGLSVAESAARANATAGGAVVFAGMTVVIALASLVVVDIPLLTVMGVAAAGTVLIAVVIAVTLMPALLGAVGLNIDRFKVPGLKTSTGAEDDVQHTFSARWAAKVTKHPGIALTAGMLIMGILSIPLLDLRLGMTDAGTKPPSSTERRAYDLLGDGFGPGFNGPLTMVIDLSDADDKPVALAEISEAIDADKGIVNVGEPAMNPEGDTAVIAAIPATGPSDKATEQLIHRLRSEVIPPVEQASGAAVQVSGSTAANIDMSEKIGNALPLFMAMVIGLTLVLLLIVFESILVPIKAAIAILLSIGASFGVIVAVFQWGWLKDVIGLEQTTPIVSFLPMMMFAILFGLSMDYEVFILSRIKEDYSRTGKARESVLTGLTSSARVITAAALIMISVFASFVLGDEPTIKMFGLGLAVAVLLDATIVRMIIVPAVMSVFGDKAWWMPKWLSRITPDLDVEGEKLMERLEAAEREESDGEADPDAALVGAPT